MYFYLKSLYTICKCYELTQWTSENLLSDLLVNQYKLKCQHLLVFKDKI